MTCRLAGAFVVSLVLLGLVGVGIDAGKSDEQKRGSDATQYQASEVVAKTPKELIELRGFKAEEHYARTVDGYFIQVVRIVHPTMDRGHLKRPVIFNHGLFESATIWLINSRDIEPLTGLSGCDLDLSNGTDFNEAEFLSGPFMLANHGYDVWLMSMQGTDFSLKHDSLSHKEPEFWNYCLDDFGLKDIPAVVNYVVEKTGATKVGYIGHSQATFSVFALLSTHPEYADVIEPVIAVAPVAYMHHTSSLGRQLFLGALLSRNQQHGPFPPDAEAIRTFAYKTCDNQMSLNPLSPRRILCDLIQELIGGKGERWLSGYYAHMPFFTSLKVLRQFGQLVKFKRFGMYDYGAEGNLQAYGNSSSPAYRIENIRSKSLVLISTRSDALSPPADVGLFKTRLRVPILRDIFIDDDFNHFDLITDKQAGSLVFGPVLQIFEDLEHKSGICGRINDNYPEEAGNSLDNEYHNPEQVKESSHQ